jgi:hypothetical protein
VSRQPFYKNIHFILIAGGLLLNFFLALGYYYINVGGVPKLSDLSGFYEQGWPILLQTFVIIYFLHFSIQYFNNKYKDRPNGFQRFMMETVFIIIVGFGIMEIFRWIFITYMVVPEEDMTFLQKKLKQIQFIDLTFLLVIYAFMTSFRIFRYLQQKQLELLKWQREYTQSQFEAVKNQLNPHFLFNSLSALTSLVYVDADLAENFIQKLSKTYRYLLEQRDKEVVPLQQEFEFLHSYTYLLEQRFGKKVNISVENIDTNGFKLPPHSLMILLEHIVNTNSMSNSKPLVIDLKQKNDQLIIDYNCQPKAAITENTKEQVKRLQEQYSFLSERKLIIIDDADKGEIRIPLVQPT